MVQESSCLEIIKSIMNLEYALQRMLSGHFRLKSVPLAAEYCVGISLHGSQFFVIKKRRFLSSSDQLWLIPAKPWFASACFKEEGCGRLVLSCNRSRSVCCSILCRIVL
jgi:hypothetical protein